MSAEAMIWADDVVCDVSDADPVSRAILSKLAGVSDDHDCAWMTVATLAKRVGVSERTIQGRLRRLSRPLGEMAKGDAEPGLGLLRATGRTYRHGTRSVPYYELMVDHVAVAEVVARRKTGRDRATMDRSRMGAAVCTHGEGADDEICTPMGAAVCTPYEANREEEEAIASSAGAREVAVFRQVVDLWPVEGLDSADLAAVEAAVRQAVEETGDAGLFVEMVAAAVADLTSRKRDYALPRLDHWLGRGGWRERFKRMRADRAKAADDPVGPVLAVPTALQEAVGVLLGGPAGISALGRAAWDGETRTLTVGNWAMGRLGPIWSDPAIAALNITLRERGS